MKTGTKNTQSFDLFRGLFGRTTRNQNNRNNNSEMIAMPRSNQSTFTRIRNTFAPALAGLVLAACGLASDHPVIDLTIHWDHGVLPGVFEDATAEVSGDLANGNNLKMPRKIEEAKDNVTYYEAVPVEGNVRLKVRDLVCADVVINCDGETLDGEITIDRLVQDEEGNVEEAENVVTCRAIPAFPGACPELWNPCDNGMCGPGTTCDEKLGQCVPICDAETCDGTCQPDGTCKPDDEPECNQDSDCPDGMCVDGVCEPNDDTTGGGQCDPNDCDGVCVDGQCVPEVGDCTNDTDCGDGEACIYGLCDEYSLCGPTETDSWTLYSDVQCVDWQSVLFLCENGKVGLSDKVWGENSCTIPASLAAKGLKEVGGEVCNTTPNQIGGNGWIYDTVVCSGEATNTHEIELTIADTPKP